MKSVVIQRMKTSNGTMGILTIENKPVCVTLERPWLDNQVDISCIPAGIYVCERIESPKYGTTYRVNDVPGRTKILFHHGNWIHESKGCILTGTSFGIGGVCSSMRARKKFMMTIGPEKYFTLGIMDGR